MLAVIVSLALSVGPRADAQEADGDSPLEQFQQAMEAGQAALESEDWEAAAEAFTRAIQITDARPEPYAGRGEALFKLEDYDAADKDFGDAILKFNEHLPARLGRGEMRLELNAPELALEDFQVALEQDRSNPRALFGMGKTEALLGGADRSIRPLTRFLEKSEETDDKRAEAFRLRAQGNAALGKFDEALQDIHSSLEINDKDHETYATLGGIFLRQQDYLRALQAINSAIQNYVPDEKAPQPYMQGYLTKASVLIEIGNQETDPETKQMAYHAAIAECDTLLQQMGDQPQYLGARAAALFSRGVALRLLGQFGEAIDNLSEAIQINPEMGEAFFRRGICFHKIGEDRLAISDFKQAATINLGDSRARLWEGFTYTKMGDYYDAIRAYGQAINESDRYTPGYVNRGLVYMLLGEHDKAVADFDEAIRLEPTNAEHYFKRGTALAKQAKHEEAADSFANAIYFDGQHVAAHRHMADSMTALGKSELANQYRSKADSLKSTGQ
jgi:tetratricopeptide (TPR) repeat protein